MPKGIYKHTEEHNRRVAEALRGRKLSEDHIKKLSFSHKGYKVLEETKKKLSLIQKSIPHKPFSEETLNKMRLAKLGKKRFPHTEETKRKISEANRGENHWMWNGTIKQKLYPLGWNNTYREQIRFRDGYKCQLCGVPEVECKRKLHVHHIDYDKTHNSEDNLISLCHQCHCRTNYNRNYWKEYFKGSKHVR